MRPPTLACSPFVSGFLTCAGARGPVGASGFAGELTPCSFSTTWPPSPYHPLTLFNENWGPTSGFAGELTPKFVQCSSRPRYLRHSALLLPHSRPSRSTLPRLAASSSSTSCCITSPARPPLRTPRFGQVRPSATGCGRYPNPRVAGERITEQVGCVQGYSTPRSSGSRSHCRALPRLCIWRVLASLCCVES